MYLRFPSIHQFSFWFGFLLATLLWWILARVRPVIIKAREDRQKSQNEVKTKTKSAAAFENRFMQETLRFAQGMHLAAPLFRLDEILQEPRFLPPPIRIEPGSPVRNEDIAETTLPYLPSWPELAAIYKVPTLSLPDALKGDSDIVILGQPGMGKSVALAALASSLARRESAYSSMDGTLPILLHCADLDTPILKDNPLNPVVETITGRASDNDKSKMPEFIHKSFSDGRVILLLDGVDETTGVYFQNSLQFINIIKHLYPKTRIVTTASFEQQGEFVLLNFAPLPIAAWSDAQFQDYLITWAKLWSKYLRENIPAERNTDHPDSLLLNGWLSFEYQHLTPLELTLKIWGGYAGDLLGPRIVDDVESHIRRMTPVEVPDQFLDQLASAIHLADKSIIDLQEDQEWLKSFEFSETMLPSSPDATPPIAQDENNSKNGIQNIPVHELFSILVKSGLFTQHGKNHIRFSHPVFGGYLASKDFRNIQPGNFPDKSAWIGKSIAFHYLACISDASFLAEKFLSTMDHPLMQNLLIVARWLRGASQKSDWRVKTLTQLVNLIQKNELPLGLRGQALAALLENSSDPSVASLFRRWMESENPDLLVLAAFGSGAIRDSKAVELLSTLTSQANIKVCRAACLALASIGTQQSLDILADILLHGDDGQRRIAAEALSNNPGEGLAILKEGATLKEDVMVRRACAYGLGRIPEPWADQLLLNLQAKDDQWAVRYAASEVLEDRQLPNPHIPMRLPPVTDSPWLIAFAGKKGIGISPEETPIEILISAFKYGSLDEKIASLDYLRTQPTNNVLGELVSSMVHSEPELREAIYRAISDMATSGVQIPDPDQWGTVNT